MTVGGFPLCSQNADLIFTCDLRLRGLTSLFILASDLPFFPFNFLLASCAVCLSFLVPLLVLTPVMHSDPLFPPAPSSLTYLFLFRCPLLCPLCILRPLTKRHTSWGEHHSLSGKPSLASQVNSCFWSILCPCF